MDLIGERYGKLTVVSESLDKARKSWLCRCECGIEKSIQENHLRSGSVVSCGCKRAAQNRTHGRIGTPEYIAWQNMWGRCRNPGHPSYSNYGGRGITVANEWKDFSVFLNHVGMRPSPKHSIDRLNNDKGYSPGNVAWRTPKEQIANRRNTMLLTVDGITKPLSIWCNETGMDYMLVFCRIHKKGWDHKRAIRTPLSLKNSHKRPRPEADQVPD